MRTIVMPSRHPVSDSFSIAGYRDIDAAQDQASYFAFLDSFADTFREMTEASVDLLRLRPGHAVLDVGCGHGVCVPLLAQRVGASGRIVGLDASHAMVAEAQRRFDHSGLPVAFRHGSALALPFDDLSFDAARADRVLLFVDDARTALAELVRVTKHGGRIAVTEGDLGLQAVDSPDAKTTATVLAALGNRSPNGWIGRRLRALFVAAGLEGVEVQLVPILSTSYAEWNLRFGIEALVSTLVAQQAIARDVAQAWLDELRTRDAQSRFTAIGLLSVVAGTRSVATAAAVAPGS
jgi:ubiquinone/menaquinone biosynthesis C-methylase UbiE